MPELPEVEGVIRSLRPVLTGQTITQVQINTPSIVYLREDLELLLSGLKILGLRRRGKYIILDFDHGSLLIHLRMTGKLLHQGEVDKHSHILFTLESGEILLYRDVRKFGRVQYFEEEGVLQEYLNRRVGLEPLEMTFTEFKLALGRKKGDIKRILLDQKVLGGIGNIYADEILFECGLQPQGKVENLTQKDLENLYVAIQSIISNAIQAGGSTIRDYRDGLGKEGNFQQRHKVYGRAHLNCVQCGRTLVKNQTAGRTTVYCSYCQKMR